MATACSGGCRLAVGSVGREGCYLEIACLLGWMVTMRMTMMAAFLLRKRYYLRPLQHRPKPQAARSLQLLAALRLGRAETGERMQASHRVRYGSDVAVALITSSQRRRLHATASRVARRVLVQQPRNLRGA